MLGSNQRIHRILFAVPVAVLLGPAPASGQASVRCSALTKTFYYDAYLGKRENMRLLGEMYRNGQCKRRDFFLADYWFREAAVRREDQVSSRLLRQLKQHARSFIDIERQRARSNDPISLRNVAWMQSKGLLPRQPDKTASRHPLRRAARLGDPVALRLIALGHDFNNQYKQAFTYSMRAARAGDIPSIEYVGKAYAIGLGTSVNYQKARFWLTRASAGGSPVAMIVLAALYLEGKGGPTNLEAFVRYKRESLRFGHFRRGFVGLAQTREAEWAVALRFGRKNQHARARVWLLRAARHRYPEAAGGLATMAEQGVGTSKSPLEAVQWFTLCLRWVDHWTRKTKNPKYFARVKQVCAKQLINQQKLLAPEQLREAKKRANAFEASLPKPD